MKCVLAQILNNEYLTVDVKENHKEFIPVPPGWDGFPPSHNVWNKQYMVWRRLSQNAHVPRHPTRSDTPTVLAI